MKRLQTTILIALSLILFTNGAIAQNKPLACQTEAAGGLAWVNKQWVTSSFKEIKFILAQSGKTLTKDSVANALRGNPEQVTCRNANSFIECTDTSGGGFFFNQQTLKGAVSQLLGSAFSTDVRDTVTVHIFSCTYF